MASSGDMASAGDRLIIEIQPSEDGLRLDKVLVARIAGLGRARARQLFAAGQILHYHGERLRPADKGARASAGQRYQVNAGNIDRTAQPDPYFPLQIAAEQGDWVIVDKPAGVPTAPLLPGETGSIANALVARYPEMAQIGYSPREPGLCHRLDTGTSGLLLAARTRLAFEQLTRAIRSSQLDKRYLLVCRADQLSETQGRISHPLMPHPRDSRRVAWIDASDPNPPQSARSSTTLFHVSARHGDLLLVEARASRAYRHQLRVHFAALGAPLLGDTLYGAAPHPALEHHALHASRICWHGSPQLSAFDVRSPLPPRLAALFE